MTPVIAETATVARHEFLTFLRRKTFLVVTFGLPVVGLAVSTALGGFGLTMGRGLATALELSGAGDGGPRAPVGYVDPGGFVKRIPGEIGTFAQFATEGEARAAVETGRVTTAYLLPADYPTSRDVVRISTGLQVRGADQSDFLSLLRANLWPAATSSDLVELANPGKRVDLALDPPRYRVARGNAAAIGLPLLLGVVLYAAIFTVSSYLLQGLTTEKETRVLEIILTSARPLSLLAGKLLGLGALGALQMGVWFGFGALLAGAGLALSARAAGLQTGPDVLVVASLYFVLGYFFYASLMAAVGAIAPSFRESGAITFVVVFPAWIPFFAMETILSDPTGQAATALSMFPPTAPLVGVMRAVSAPIPLAEVVLSLTFLLLGALGVVWVASRLFGSTLLLGQAIPAPRAIAAALRKQSA
jgi:ABC-2 type transport system permease protein